jgi:hypothetical protein
VRCRQTWRMQTEWQLWDSLPLQSRTKSISRSVRYVTMPLKPCLAELKQRSSAVVRPYVPRCSRVSRRQSGCDSLQQLTTKFLLELRARSGRDFLPDLVQRYRSLIARLRAATRAQTDLRRAPRRRSVFGGGLPPSASRQLVRSVLPAHCRE